jgi:hypothetical protein
MCSQMPLPRAISRSPMMASHNPYGVWEPAR